MNVFFTVYCIRFNSICLFTCTYVHIRYTLFSRFSHILFDYIDCILERPCSHCISWEFPCKIFTTSMWLIRLFRVLFLPVVILDSRFKKFPKFISSFFIQAILYVNKLNKKISIYQKTVVYQGRGFRECRPYSKAKKNFSP